MFAKSRISLGLLPRYVTTKSVSRAMSDLGAKNGHSMKRLDGLLVHMYGTLQYC
ncbi:uncharacterized protein J3R85_018688 [Psidium guajava]|nr:uncharacterized protein J3R85_018688 [Psidium guajava]